MSESASTTPDRAGAAGSGAGGEKRGFFGRIVLFVRQVVAELKKVVRPTRNELWTYFVVVLVFVAVIMAFVGVLDLGFARLAFWVFGD